jgi:hypothetical protein
MSPSYRDATINSVEANPTVSGSTGGGRDENGKPYFFPNISISIGYWFDNEGIPNSDWDTHFTAKLFINGSPVETKQVLSNGGPQTYSFFTYKFPEPGTYTAEVRGKNSKSVTITIKSPEQKKAA